jgi:hypothetical protein
MVEVEVLGGWQLAVQYSETHIARQLHVGADVCARWAASMVATL